MLSTLTWADVLTLLQDVFTFLTAIVAFVAIGMNRNIKAVDVWLGCQTRHGEIMEKLYRLPYSASPEEEPHPGLDAQGLVSESELFALFNIFWHLIHDEYQFWRDKYISNEMFFRRIDGVFDELRRNYTYYSHDTRGKEVALTYKELWERTRGHWFRNRSFAKFMAEVNRQQDSNYDQVNAGMLMKYKPRKYRRVG